jgi:hypothetical protein
LKSQQTGAAIGLPDQRTKQSQFGQPPQRVCRLRNKANSPSRPFQAVVTERSQFGQPPLRVVPLTEQSQFVFSCRYGTKPIWPASAASCAAYGNKANLASLPSECAAYGTKPIRLLVAFWVSLQNKANLASLRSELCLLRNKANFSSRRFLRVLGGSAVSRSPPLRNSANFRPGKAPTSPLTDFPRRATRSRSTALPAGTPPYVPFRRSARDGTYDTPPCRSSRWARSPRSGQPCGC